MYLLDTYTGQFVQKDLRDKRTVYAILSHTWSDDPGAPEPTHRQLQKIQKRYSLQPQISQACAEIPQPLLPSLQGPRDFPMNPSLIHNPAAALTSTISSSSHLRKNEGISTSPNSADSKSTDSSKDSRTASSEEPHSSQPNTFLSPIWEDRKLHPKIRDACAIARTAGYRYIWIDSCCIDKSSSSELSEAINSMYHWYGRSAMCYAYLADVPPGEDPRAARSSFRRSRWYTRGWTLQELIAPGQVLFLSSDWNVIGSKHTLSDVIEEITGIADEALLHMKPLDDFSVAQRLSWAAARKTTRVEDRAYSLLGVFSINMPILYGEGDLAFRRLQEEILRRIPDQSLFAWEEVCRTPFNTWSNVLVWRHDRDPVLYGYPTPCSPSLIAVDIERFAVCGSSIRRVLHETVYSRLGLSHLPTAEYTFTPHGIRTQLPCIPICSHIPGAQFGVLSPEVQLEFVFLAILGCTHVDHDDCLLGRVCYIPSSESGLEFLYSAYIHCRSLPLDGNTFGLFLLSPATIERKRRWIQLKTVFIPYSNRGAPDSHEPRAELINIHTVSLILRRSTIHALRVKGYTAELRGPGRDGTTAHMLTLSNDDHTIIVEFQQILQHDECRWEIRAHAKMLLLIGSTKDTKEIEANPATVLYEDSRPWSNWVPAMGPGSIVFSPIGSKRTTLKFDRLHHVGHAHYAVCVDVHGDISRREEPQVLSDDGNVSMAQAVEAPKGVQRAGNENVLGADGLRAGSHISISQPSGEEGQVLSDDRDASTGHVAGASEGERGQADDEDAIGADGPPRRADPNFQSRRRTVIGLMRQASDGLRRWKGKLVDVFSRD